MKVLSLYDIETRSTHFTLVITGVPSTYYVARYWNVPRRNTGSAVGRVTQQWSGEVSCGSLDEAMSLARAQIESLDGPILEAVESRLYTQKAPAPSLKLVG